MSIQAASQLAKCMMLHNLTNAINFIALMAALWLGLYLVTRSPQRRETWLTALAFWSMGGYFLNQLLALNPPPIPSEETGTWIYHLAIFWPRNVFEMGWQGWLQGWLPSYGIVFWYHATLYMLPGRFDRKRGIIALTAYAVALAGILVKVRFGSQWINPPASPLYSSSPPDTLFPLFGLGFVAFAGLSVRNLATTMRSLPAAMPPHQFRLFIYASLLGAVTGLAGIISSLLNVPLPQVINALLLLGVVLLTGVGVARYNALLDRRPLQRDFIYSAGEASAILLAYLFFLELFSQLYPLPEVSFVFAGGVAIISHLLIDVTRLHLDRVFFHQKRHLLRARLHRLYGLMEEEEIDNVLDRALATVAKTVQARWLVLVQFTQDGLLAAGSCNWTGKPIEEAISVLSESILSTDDLVVLNPQNLPPPFNMAALIVPLYAQKQTGSLLVGPSINQAGYSEPELEALQYGGDLLASVLGEIDFERRELVSPREAAFVDTVEGVCFQEEIHPRLVELCLRNLHDYAYLSDSPLAELSLVDKSLEKMERSTYTHIERGKALSMVLTEAVHRLKPDQDEPIGAPPRTWYPYIVLREAYICDEPNREIMSRLYISEGTFNRTRRAAITSVARLLMEMEAGIAISG